MIYMRPINNQMVGFTLIEVIVAIAIFALFSFGVFEGVRFIYKVVYVSRIRILETALLSEELEIVRNVSYGDVGISGGVPSGILEHEKTVTKNGINFNLITTVRNIDDSFDGTIGGEPNDVSPADYKLVEISAICSNCEQKEPVIVSARVSPKQLEGASDNGALFIQVFDANGLPVEGANVYVINTSTSPDTIIDDTTDSTGFLRIIDTPTGTLSYNILVTKDGYSSDYTVTSSVANPNPIIPPATVISQSITDVSFSIDRLSSMDISTVNQGCAAVGSVKVFMYGDKILGTDPSIYKYSSGFYTDGSGNYSFPSLEWDKYFIVVTTTYDVAGSIPLLPVNLTPGLHQEATLVLRTHTTNSLLVQVKDAGTGLPLSDTSVRLYKTGYDSTLVTGFGYVRQTDWGGGSGQTLFINETKYWTDNGNISASSGDVKLKKSGSHYATSGWLESSTFDLGTVVDFSNIVISGNQPAQTGVNSLKFYIATSNSSTPVSWNFVGPDGTAGTYYTVTSTLINSMHDDQRYLRYRAFLTTTDNHYTPTLSELAFTFTTGCTPPGQVFFYSLSADDYVCELTRSGYASSSSTITISGNNTLTAFMSPE
ncbi:MAG: hypothetical protein COU29_02505 [Candidatus Magasanikbacteria bacterium CG10_big_fil_rev_8_21_14_0_10_36_32]|uniref:Uncharacterized protein n=1 Tax=Candidatus Magasanikbacteria bacterium CG10_big_fil_rev_8_21_14_0_10_36_32 TaxID=1974646 RepID=A0A2M6W764_9BACT|nr:MAG: hypothetical protein COU29_02505 [Candidatus Magasanikbacteria bacterium CG10_big_fil_rev_8_21_14_0_10_36_32]